jgi:hypothetical protein
MLQTVNVLQEGTKAEKEAATTRILDAPERFIPPVFYVLAQELFRQGRKEDALFWLNAGRLRAGYDVYRCADSSVAEALMVMYMDLPPDLRAAQLEDVERLKQILARVLDWDATTPYAYDHRWINLHGLGSYTNSFSQLRGMFGNVELESLSVPEDQWPELRGKAREDFRAGLEEAIAELQRKSGDGGDCDLCRNDGTRNP